MTVGSSAGLFESLPCAWPGVKVGPTAFQHHLERLGSSAGAVTHVSELYLAFACGKGDPAAHGHFEAQYANALRDGVKRVERDADVVDEVVQELRHKLFVADPPKIWKYTGRGPLAAWLRVVASRAAADHGRDHVRRERGNFELPHALPAIESSLDTKLDRARYMTAFQSALADAIGTLTPRERNVLRLHYATGVSIDEIGRAYRVHRATAARWITRIRDQLFGQIRAALRDGELGLSEHDFHELAGIVNSRLDLIMSSWMRSRHDSMNEHWAEEECPRSA